MRSDMELEKAIGVRLREKGWTLSAAESCTGGLVSDRITDVPGSSDYFEGGIVSYSIKAKAKHLGIPIKYIEHYGAVSRQVAERMAEGVRKAFNTTIGLSTTGVAGPTGGTKKTPVGTVFIGVAGESGTLVKKLNLKGSRREIKVKAAEEGLQFLFERLACSETNPPYPLLKGGKMGFSGFHGNRSTLAQWIDGLRHSKESEMVILRKGPKGISRPAGRLGIFPASFNPPTMAHVALVREARKEGRLDEILILLDIQAMDKEACEAKFEHRLTMVKRVFGRDPKISIGLSSGGLFLQKLKPLGEYYPSSVEIFFIVGFDTILRVMDGKYYRNRKGSLSKLFCQSRFIVANRGDQEKAAFLRLFNQPDNLKYRDKLSFFTLSPKFSTLSSSLIREGIRRRLPVDEWIPAPALRFIREKGLYEKMP
jgi:nicotinamide-nucleotide amidase